MAPISDVKIRNAKPKKKMYKLYDQNGLYLIVAPSGGKWWRFDYMHNGKRKTLSFGTYPKVSLKDAREKRDEAKRFLTDGIEPSVMKKEMVAFGSLAQEWFDNKRTSWSPRHVETIEQRIRTYIDPAFGKRPVQEITTPEIFKFLQGIQQTGKIETAHRVKQIISMIFRYGIVKGVATRDPASDLGRGMLVTSKPKHYPTILDPVKVGALMRAIDGYESLIVRCALKLLALTFVRPGELRCARWEEIHFEDALWEIPPERMKMKRPHIVPLSNQAISVLKNVRVFTGKYPYIFPATRGKDRPISEMTMNAALQRMGYNTSRDITPHGFRAMARTILHEKLKFPPEVIEHQLAHAVSDNLGEAYNRTKFLDERKTMMQAWADYLDQVKTTFKSDQG